MTRRGRVILAFALGLFVSVAMCAYLVAYALGIPAFLLTKSWRLKAMASYAAIGGAAAMVPAALLLVVLPGYGVLAGSAVCGGFAAGLVFGALARAGL